MNWDSRDDAGVLPQLTTGMRVIDADGVMIGILEAVEADESGGRGAADGTPAGVIKRVVDAVTDPDPDRGATPDGHLRVDARSTLGQVVYVPVGLVARVDSDGVILTMSLHDLPTR